MNTSINYSGFIDMFTDPDEKLESYKCNDTNEALEKIYNTVQAYKAGFNDREYVYNK